MDNKENELEKAIRIIAATPTYKAHEQTSMAGAAKGGITNERINELYIEHAFTEASQSEISFARAIEHEVTTNLASQSQAAQPNELTDELIESAYQHGFDDFAGPKQFRHASNFADYHKAGLRAARAAIVTHLAGQSQATRAVPDILFDGHAVYAEVQAHAACRTRTSAENVSDTLDAVVRLLRRAAPTAQEAAKEAQQSAVWTEADRRAAEEWVAIRWPRDATGSTSSAPAESAAFRALNAKLAAFRAALEPYRYDSDEEAIAKVSELVRADVERRASAPAAQEVTQQAAKAETADQAVPVGHVVTWNKGGSGEVNSIEPIGKSGYSLAASLPEGTLIYLAPTTSTVSAPEDLVEKAAKLCDSAGHHWSGAPALAMFELADAIRALHTTSGKGEAA